MDPIFFGGQNSGISKFSVQAVNLALSEGMPVSAGMTFFGSGMSSFGKR